MRPRRRNRQDQKSPPSRTLSAGQHLHRDRRFPWCGLDHQALRRRRERPLRGSKASFRRPLLAPPRHLRQSSGSPIPPRGLQPVPLEPVLVCSGRLPPSFRERRCRCRVVVGAALRPALFFAYRRSHPALPSNSSPSPTCLWTSSRGVLSAMKDLLSLSAVRENQKFDTLLTR